MVFINTVTISTAVNYACKGVVAVILESSPSLSIILSEAAPNLDCITFLLSA